MLIEFMGLPGAGKSTIARGVCTRLRQSGYRLVWAPDAFMHTRPGLLRAYKLARMAAFGVRHPRVACDAVRCGRSFPQPTRAAAARLVGNWMYVTAMRAMRQRPGELVVLDQGLVQGLYSLALQSDGDWRLAVRRALAVVSCPDVVVSIEAPGAVVRERMLCRAASHSATERLLLADQRWLDRSVRILEHMRQALGERGVHVLRCDSVARSVPAAIDLIAGAIVQRQSPVGRT